MLSTAIYPAFSERPAAFSRAIATGELRGRIGFRGVSITDALQSAAAQAFGGPAKVGRAAARAGTDLLLFAAYRAAAAGRRGAAQGAAGAPAAAGPVRGLGAAGARPARAITRRSGG